MLTLEHQNNELILKQELEFITEQSIINFDKFLKSPELLKDINTIIANYGITELLLATLNETITLELTMPNVFKKIGFLLQHKLQTTLTFQNTNDINKLLKSPTIYKDLLRYGATKNNMFYNQDIEFWNEHQLSIFKAKHDFKDMVVNTRINKNEYWVKYLVFLSIVTGNELYLIFDVIHNDLAIADGVGLKQAMKTEGTIAIGFRYPFIPNDKLVDEIRKKYGGDTIEWLVNRCEELIVDNSIHQFSIEKKENNYIISRVMIAGPRDETEELILRNSGGHGANNRIIHNRKVQYKEITIREKITKSITT